MTREQIKKIFPDITEDQLKAILDINSADIGEAKGDSEKLKEELEKAKESVQGYEKQVAELKESLDKGEDFKKKFLSISYGLGCYIAGKSTFMIL